MHAKVNFRGGSTNVRLFEPRKTSAVSPVVGGDDLRECTAAERRGMGWRVRAGHDGVAEDEPAHGDGMSSSAGLCEIVPGELTWVGYVPGRRWRARRPTPGS
jgi:hypothetical protein